MSANNPLLDVLTRHGVLINASIRYWRGCKKLKPEELGLNPSDISDRLISLGHKRLLPKDALSELNLVEGRAHALIEFNTFPFLNGLAHFLPNQKLEEVTDKLKALKQDFWQAKKHFLEQYASLRDAAAKEWRAMAEKLMTDSEQLVGTIESSGRIPGQRFCQKSIGARAVTVNEWFLRAIQYRPISRYPAVLTSPDPAFGLTQLNTKHKNHHSAQIVSVSHRMDQVAPSVKKQAPIDLAYRAFYYPF
jgi:hypothetical protein